MDIGKLENNLIAKRLTIKTKEVNVMDMQWVKAMWVNAIISECYRKQKLTSQYSMHAYQKVNFYCLYS